MRSREELLKCADDYIGYADSLAGRGASPDYVTSRATIALACIQLAEAQERNDRYSWQEVFNAMYAVLGKVFATDTTNKTGGVVLATLSELNNVRLRGGSSHEKG